MARPIDQMKYALQNANTDLTATRQIAMEFAQHLEGLAQQIATLQDAYNTHGHSLWTNDLNGKQIELGEGEVVGLSGRKNPTAFGFGPAAGPGSPVKLSRPRPT